MSIQYSFQTNSTLESERDDVRKSVRGEFSSAIDALSKERGRLLSEVSQLRLKLSQLSSSRDAEEKERKSQMEAEMANIQERYEYLPKKGGCKLIVFRQKIG